MKIYIWLIAVILISLMLVGCEEASVNVESPDNSILVEGDDSTDPPTIYLTANVTATGATPAPTPTPMPCDPCSLTEDTLWIGDDSDEPAESTVGDLLGLADWGVIHDFTHWTAPAPVGSGTTSNTFRRAEISTVNWNNTSSARVYISWLPTSIPLTNDFDIVVTFQNSQIYSDANNRCWIMFGRNANTAADPTSGTVGFRLDNSALKGIVYNAGLTVVDLSTTISAGSTVYLLRIRCDLDAATPTIYWDVNGVNVGSTTTIMSNFSNPMYCTVSAAATANGGLSGGAYAIYRWAYSYIV